MINYDLGDDFNFTTPSPDTTTSKVPNKEEGIKMFILPVNETDFADNKFPILIGELDELANKSRCRLIHTPALSCRAECYMSEDPSRGCIYVILGLIYDPLICEITTEQFKQQIEEKVQNHAQFFLKIFYFVIILVK